MPIGLTSRAHGVSRTWAPGGNPVRTTQRSCAHRSVRWCALQNPLVRTAESSRAHQSNSPQ